MGKRLAALEDKLQIWLERANRGHHLVGIAALISFGGTLTAAYPVSAVIVTAVMLSPRRWLRLSLACATGSALAGAVIVGVSHILGYNEIHHLFPKLLSVETWNEGARWVGEYGVWAIFGVGASPLPQMPLLIFFGIVDDRIGEAFLALLGGKVLKYGLIAWVTQHFPERFAFFRRINGQSANDSGQITR
jgi:membrane protein YqaA with SNARE-associated domain